MRAFSCIILSILDKCYEYFWLWVWFRLGICKGWGRLRWVKRGEMKISHGEKNYIECWKLYVTIISSGDLFGQCSSFTISENSLSSKKYTNTSKDISEVLCLKNFLSVSETFSHLVYLAVPEHNNKHFSWLELDEGFRSHNWFTAVVAFLTPSGNSWLLFPVYYYITLHMYIRLWGFVLFIFFPIYFPL